MVTIKDSTHPADAFAVYLRHPDGDDVFVATVPADEDPEDLRRILEAATADRGREIASLRRRLGALVEVAEEAASEIRTPGAGLGFVARSLEEAARAARDEVGR